MADAWTNEIDKLNMEINIKKSKVMIINNIGNDQTTTCKQETAHSKRAIVFTMSLTHHFQNQFQKRRQRRQQRQVYKVIVVPSLSYRSELWTPLKKHQSQFEAANMRFLRKTAGKSKYNKVRNEEIREIINQESMTLKLKKTQLNWFGHVMRMNLNRLTRKILETGKEREAD